MTDTHSIVPSKYMTAAHTALAQARQTHPGYLDHEETMRIMLTAVWPLIERDIRAETPETARLTADVVVIGIHARTPHVLLIERGWEPHAGRLALPGGHVDAGEDVEDAARRELAEETGIDIDWFEEVGTYSTPGRDPRGRYVTFAYLAMVEGLPDPSAGDDARSAAWWPLADVLAHPTRLAFDHAQILADAAALLGG